MLVKPTENYNSNGYNVKYTFGGTNSVKKNGGERIAGSDRFDTSAKIAAKTGYKNIAFVSGTSFADALSAVNVVNSKTADILLTPTNGNKEVSKLAKEAENIYIIGGENTLPENNVLAAIDGKAISKPVVKKPVKSNEKLIKNISGYNLAFKETPDISSIVSTKRVNLLNNNDLSFVMKSPERGNFFTIYVSDYLDRESDGLHERNIGTLYSGNSKYSVLLEIGLQPNYSNEYKYFSALDKVITKIGNGALIGTDGSRFELNRGYFNSMKNTFVKVPKQQIRKPAPKPVVKTSITVPGTNGKVRINLPSNVASRIEFDPSGKYIINKKAYEYSHNLDVSTIIGVSLQNYVGTNKNHHNFAESNTYGTFVKNGKKYSLNGDYSFTSFRYDSNGELTQHNIDEMNVDLHAILHALETHNTTGLIH